MGNHYLLQGIFLTQGPTYCLKVTFWKRYAMTKQLLHLRSCNIYRNGKCHFSFLEMKPIRVCFHFFFLFETLWFKCTKIYWKVIFNIIVLASQGAEKNEEMYHWCKEINLSNLSCFPCFFPFVPIYHYLLPSMGSAGIYLLMGLLEFKPKDWNKPFFTKRYHLFSFGLLGSY